MNQFVDDNDDNENDDTSNINDEDLKYIHLEERIEVLENIYMNDVKLIMDYIKGKNLNPIASTIVIQTPKPLNNNDIDSDDILKSEDEDDSDEFTPRCPFYFSFNTCCCSSK